MNTLDNSKSDMILCGTGSTISVKPNNNMNLHMYDKIGTSGCDQINNVYLVIDSSLNKEMESKSRWTNTRLNYVA